MGLRRQREEITRTLRKVAGGGDVRTERKDRECGERAVTKKLKSICRGGTRLKNNWTASCQVLFFRSLHIQCCMYRCSYVPSYSGAPLSLEKFLASSPAKHGPHAIVTSELCSIGQRDGDDAL